MCRHCDTVICSLMLCEWLLYCSCFFTLLQGLKEQIEADENVLKMNIETQTIANYSRWPNKDRGNIKRSVQELREKQNQLQATIDGLKTTVEALNQTVKLLCGQPKVISTCLVGVVTTSKWTEIPLAMNIFKVPPNIVFS